MLLAPGRAERSDAFEPHVVESDPEAAARCPFCAGREDRTPSEVWARRPGGGPADTSGWEQRSVPNLYPALAPTDELAANSAASRVPGDPAERATAPAVDSGLTSAADPLRSSARSSEPELFKRASARGAHEVIVNCPWHATGLAELGAEGLAGAVAAWRERVAAHAESSSYVHLSVNQGPEAGASLEHSHAQLFALPFVPTEIARERERHNAYHERTMGGHLLEDVLVEEVRRRERLVAIDEEAALICPWASGYPFEMRLIPRTREARFDRDERGSALLHRALAALSEMFGAGLQLNLWVRTAPRGTEEFHWHLDIVPRLTIKAGFELGTGVNINVYPPERAAGDLREALGT